MSDIQLIEVGTNEVELIEVESAGVTVVVKDPVLLLICAETLSGHRAVTCNRDGMLIYADKDTPEHGHKLLGITTHAAESGSFCTVLRYGELTEPSWSWETDKPVFVGEAGMLTQTPPETGFSVIIGFPIKPDTLSVRIQTTVYLEG